MKNLTRTETARKQQTRIIIREDSNRLILALEEPDNIARRAFAGQVRQTLAT